MTEEQTLLKECFSMIEDVFKDSPHKASLWWATPNPLLGGVAPHYMVYIGRTEKLHKFIKALVDENK